jgi:hypothetical protein
MSNFILFKERLSLFLLWLGFQALSLMASLSLITDKVGSRAGKAMAIIGLLLLLRYWKKLVQSSIVCKRSINPI